MRSSANPPASNANRRERLNMAQGTIRLEIDNDDFEKAKQQLYELYKIADKAAERIELSLQGINKFSEKTPFNNEIILNQYVPEFLFRVYPEINYNTTYVYSDPVPIFMLVYRYSKQISETEFLYSFVGGRKG